MNILVLIKQVPRDEDLKLDPVTKTLIRPQTGVISEYDKYAVEMAVRLKSDLGGKVTAITMGPPASSEVLRYALAVGVDEVFLLSDRLMGGADAYATVTALKAGKEYIEKQNNAAFDLVLCGKQASDSDTSLVMPEMAEALGLPQVTFVQNYEIADGKVRVARETDDGTDLLELNGPTVISVGKTDFDYRLPNLRLKLKANHAEIPTLNAAAIGVDAAEVGVPGSRTTVGSSYIVEHKKDCVKIDSSDPAAAAAELLAKLYEARML